MDDLCRAIANLPTGTLWRHNQAGDLPGKGARIASKQLAKLVAANASAQAKGFTYTHKPMTEANQKAVKHANQHGFTVNLSANSLVHADQLADLNIGPVASVVPHIGKARGPYEGPKQGTTGKGRKWAVCPAILDHDGKRGITCENCQLCSKADRSVIVAFPAHGSAYKSASIASIDDETKRRRALVKQAVVAARANK